MVNVLQDSLAYMEHAGRNQVSIADVRLATQARESYSFTGPLPREVDWIPSVFLRVDVDACQNH